MKKVLFVESSTNDSQNFFSNFFPAKMVHLPLPGTGCTVDSAPVKKFGAKNSLLLSLLF